LQEVLAGRSGTAPERLVIGVVDAVPKLLAYRLVRPALAAPNRLRLVIREDRLERLLADLATHEVDVVLSDRGAPSGVRVKAFSHLLGESGITIFGVAELAAACRRRFPRSLQGVPFIMPAADSELRRSLERWFESHQVQPTVVAEIDDSALLKAFGQAGAGLFAAPTAIEAEVRRQYGVRVTGRVDAIRERFYAISAERRITHPAVTAITSAARSNLFGS
jgi:LysR family transcriptional activator of nhaA